MAEAVSGPGIVVELTEDDVPGASLDEPMEKQSVPALKRWLLCRGIEMPASTRKKQLLERYCQLSGITTILGFTHAIICTCIESETLRLTVYR